MRQFAFLLVTVGLILAAPTSGLSQGPDDPTADGKAPGPETPSDRSREQVEQYESLRKELATALTGATLVGHFTVDDDLSDKPLKPDRYTISQVTPVKDDHFLFVYVHQGIPIPLTLKVLWAGDTPVLTLDEFTIAGMGTFSARLMFRLKSDRYAGTWQHGEKGGLMFGRIERAKPRQAPAPAADSSPAVPAPQNNRPGSDDRPGSDEKN